MLYPAKNDVLAYMMSTSQFLSLFCPYEKTGPELCAHKYSIPHHRGVLPRFKAIFNKKL